MGNMYTVIYGPDLIRFMKKQDPEFANELDKQGINVVHTTMLHNDTDIRAILLCKVTDKEEPVEAFIDFPLTVWNKIARKLFYDTSAARA